MSRLALLVFWLRMGGVHVLHVDSVDACSGDWVLIRGRCFFGRSFFLSFRKPTDTKPTSFPRDLFVLFANSGNRPDKTY